MYYATIDADGIITGLFPEKIFPTPPAGAITMMPDEYAQACAGQLVRDVVLDVWVEKPAPVRTPAQAREERLATLAAYRYAVETGGITVGGITVATDRESQAMLTGAWVRLQQAPDLLIDWKGETGWTQLDKSSIDALAAAVGTHVQACFTAERVHAEAIMALVEDVEEIDGYDVDAGWP